jgi:hypothetical protein
VPAGNCTLHGPFDGLFLAHIAAPWALWKGVCRLYLRFIGLYGISIAPKKPFVKGFFEKREEEGLQRRRKPSEGNPTVLHEDSVNGVNIHIW